MFFLYYPGEGALCSIPIENILAVERLEEESFKMKNVRRRRVVGRNVAVQVRRLLSHFLSRVPDVPGYSARASPLHPGQQLRRGPRLDWHPDQSESVQPQTLKHLPSFSLPQRPLALLQALSGHRPWVHALHWVRKRWSDLVQQHVSVFYTSSLTLSSVSSGLPANIQLDVDGDRETERIYSLFSTYMPKMIKMQGQTSAGVFAIDSLISLFFHRAFTVRHHSHSAARLFPQRPVAVSLCTTGQSRRSTPASSSMTPRRLTKPLNRSFQPCRPWSSSTPSTSATSSRRQR